MVQLPETKQNLLIISICAVVGIDIQDDLGRHDVGFIENTLKTPWNDGKGCIFESRFHINRVPGSI